MHQPLTAVPPVIEQRVEQRVPSPEERKQRWFQKRLEHSMWRTSVNLRPYFPLPPAPPEPEPPNLCAAILFLVGMPLANAYWAAECDYSAAAALEPRLPGICLPKLACLG